MHNAESLVCQGLRTNTAANLLMGFLQDCKWHLQLLCAAAALTRQLPGHKHLPQQHSCLCVET